MQNELNQFNLIFNNDEAFIEYLVLVFSDSQFTDEQLREFITETVYEALEMYKRNNGDTCLPAYVTQVVKTSIQELKSALKQ